MLVIPIWALTPHQHTPKGRSETTFVSVAVGRDRDRDRVDRACDDDPSPHPTTHPKRPLWTCVSRANDFESVRTKKIRPTCIIGIYWARGAAQEPLWPTPPPSHSRKLHNLSINPNTLRRIADLFWSALAGQMISSVRRTRRKPRYAPAY